MPSNTAKAPRAASGKSMLLRVNFAPLSCAVIRTSPWSVSLSRSNLRELLAPLDHVLQRAEGGHVVTLETSSFEAAEQVRKIEIPVARLEVDLLAVAPAVGEPNLVAAPKIERFQKSLDPFGNKMGMVGGERPAQ